MLDVEAPGVAANDVDIDGDTLTVALVSPPANGTLDLNLNGSFTYAPDANFNGGDSFTYEVFDAEAVSGGIGTVDLTVTAVNDVPLAGNDNFGVILVNTPLTVPAPGVLVNDSDLEGSPVTAVLARGPRHGGLTLNPDGSFTYTPDPGYVGSDDFRYKANDGALNSLEAIVSFEIVLPADVLFMDGFESNDTSAWSATLP
jgi:hypothetical protein